jgi:hypothetical protein
MSQIATSPKASDSDTNRILHRMQAARLVYSRTTIADNYSAVSSMTWWIAIIVWGYRAKHPRRTIRPAANAGA